MAVGSGTPTVKSVRDALATELEKVKLPAPGVKNVQKYRRNIKTFNDFEKTFGIPAGKGGRQKINGWVIEPPGSTIDPGINLRAFVKVATWTITGYLSAVDRKESEIFAEDLLEAIENQFMFDTSLGGVVTAIQQIRTGIESPITFGEHQVHICPIELDIETRHQQVC